MFLVQVNCGERRIGQCALIMHSYRFFVMFPFFSLFFFCSTLSLHLSRLSSFPLFFVLNQNEYKSIGFNENCKFVAPDWPIPNCGSLSLSRRPLCHKLMIKQYKTHTGACIYIIHTASIISFVAVRNGNKITGKKRIYPTKIIYYRAYSFRFKLVCVFCRCY